MTRTQPLRLLRSRPAHLALDFAFLLDPPCADDPAGFQAFYDARELFDGPGNDVDLEVKAEHVPTAVLAAHGPFELDVSDAGVRLQADDLDVLLDPWTGRTEPGSGPFHAEPGTGVVEGDRLLALAEFERVFGWDGWVWSAFTTEEGLAVGYWLVQ